MSAPDLMAALQAAIDRARAARQEQAKHDQAVAATPKPRRALPPITKGDITLDGYSSTTRICALCDTGIHVGTPIVRHWPAAASHANDAYHPACYEERTHD